MQVYGINTQLPPKYGNRTYGTEFRAFVDGKYMTREEFVAHAVSSGKLEGAAHKIFSEYQMDAIQKNYEMVQALQQNLENSSSGSFGFSLPTMSRYVDTLNQRAVKQIFGPKAYHKWEEVSELLKDGQGSRGAKIIGFDLETFGNIQSGKGIFGITEIGVGELTFAGSGKIGEYLGKEKGYDAFVIAPTSEQQIYMESVLKKMRNNPLGFEGLDNDEQVLVRRLSMYGGKLNDVFAKKTVPSFFDPTTPRFTNTSQGSAYYYWTVKNLSPENVTYARANNGLNNLRRIAADTGRQDPLNAIVNFFTNLDEDNTYFYGANSNFDFDGLMNVMIARGGFSDEQFKKIRSIKESSLDVVYALQAAAASHNMDVATFQKEILEKNYAGATVAEQLHNFFLSGEQQHQSYSDDFTEGKLLVHHISEIFDKYLVKEDADGSITSAGYLADRVEDSIISPDRDLDIRFFVKRDILDRSDGNEFGIVPISKNKEAPVSNISLTGQWWQIDPNRTGKQEVNGETQYILTLMNSADALRSKDKNINRAVFMFDSQAKMDRKIEEIARASQIGLIGEDVTEKTITDAQVTRYIDIGRREIERFKSASEVAINPGEYDTTYGFGQLKRVIDFREKLEKFSPSKSKLLVSRDPSGEIHQEVFSSDAVVQLRQAVNRILTGNKVDGGTKKEFRNMFRTPYQFESFLGVNAALEASGDYDFYKFLVQEIDSQFGHVNDPKYDVLKTVALKRAYDTASDIASRRVEDYSKYTVSEAFNFTIDQNGVDLFDPRQTFKPDAKLYRLNYTNGIDDANRTVQSMLKDVDRDTFKRIIGKTRKLDGTGNRIGELETLNKSSRTQQLSLVGRGLLTEEEADSILASFDEVNRNDWFLAGRISSAIYSHMDPDNESIVRTWESIGDKTLRKMFHKPIPFGENSEVANEIRSAISGAIADVANIHYDQVDSSIFETMRNGTQITMPNTKGEHIIREILNYLNMGEEDVGVQHQLIAQIFDSNKTYSIGNYKDQGVQAFLVKPTDANSETFTGDNMYLLVTNRKHVGKVTELLPDIEDWDLGKLNETELADHAAIVPLFHINKRPTRVDEDGNIISSIVTVNQGPVFERRLLPTLRTFDDDGVLKVYFNEPEYEIGSLFRQGGKLINEHVVKDDFKGASRAYTRIRDKYLVKAPASASYYGVEYMMHITPNDAVSGDEVRIVEGVASIFKRAALQDIDAGNLNPAQQLVVDFMALQRGKLPNQLLVEPGTVTKDNISRVLSSNSWQEFFRRRLVTGSVADEQWILSGPSMNNRSVSWNFLLTHEGAYKNSDYNIATRFDFSKKSFLEITRDMAERSDLFDDFVDRESAIAAFSNIPRDMSLINPIGSESQVHHGSVFYGRYPGVNSAGEKEFYKISFADYHPFSGMYNIMRPLYIQQGNPMTYTAGDVETALSVSGMKLTELMKQTIDVNGTQIDILPVTFGTNSIESTEYEAWNALRANNVTVDEHEFLLRTKTMSGLELSDRLAKLESEEKFRKIITDGYVGTGTLTRGTNGKMFNIDKSVYDEIVSQFSQDFGSLYEDKGLISPALKNTGLFQKRDGMSFSIDWDRVDKNKTLEDLQALARRAGDSDKMLIRNGDVIGRRIGGTDIIHTKSDVYLTKKDLLTLLESSNSGGRSKSVRLETIGDIVDDKIMIFGLEKATTHSVDMSAIEGILKKHFNEDDSVIKEEALRIATLMYQDISDGAAMILNPKFAKHGGIPSLESDWNTIVRHYSNYNGNSHLNELVEILNGQTFEEYTKDIRGPAFRVEDVRMNGSQTPNYRLVANLSQINQQAKFMFELKDEIKRQAAAGSKPAQMALAEMQYNMENYILNATAHRQIMNDHLGTSMLVDIRVQEAMGMRGMTEEGGFLKESLEWVNQFKKYAYDYDGSYDSFVATGTHLDNEALVSAENFYSKSYNYDRMIHNAHQVDAQRTLTGMIESYEYYSNKGLSRRDIQSRNIISISIEDILGAHEYGVQTGIELSDRELQQSLFFIDGEPSKFLLEHARRNGISKEKLKEESFSLFIDMGDYKPASSDRVYEGFLVPLQNMSHIEGNRTLYRDSPRSFSGFIHNVARAITKRTDEGTSLSSELYSIYRDYMENDILPQTNVMKKESDMYKIMQQYVAPNSSELFAQDEATPLIAQWADQKYTREVIDESGNPVQKTIKELLELRQSYEDQLVKSSGISSDPADVAEYIAKYNDIDEKISSISKQIAEEISPTDPANSRIYHELMSLGQSDAMKKATEITVNGQKYNGVVVGLSKEGFNRLGFDFGIIGRDIIQDYQLHNETNTYRFEGTETLITDIKNSLDTLVGDGTSRGTLHDKMEAAVADIIQQYNKSDIDVTAPDFADSLKAQDGKPISVVINDYIKRTQGALAEFNTRGLNEEIAHKLERTFNDAVTDTGLGLKYMKDVGTFSEFIRFPVFESQPMVRLVYDETARQYQARISNPILSLVTNLDFDGDKVFLATMANGMSVLPKTSDAYKNMRAIYENFAVNNAPKLLREAFLSGDAFRVENPNDAFAQINSLFQIVDDAKFNQAAANYIKKVLPEYKDASIDSIIQSLTEGELKKNKGLTSALMHSEDLVKKFHEEIGNITSLEAAETAGITSRWRKVSIGSISTPSFRLRETLNTVLRADDQLTDENRVLLNKLLIGLSNMDSKSGGLLSYAEQSAIDTKWIKDTNILSRAEEFSRHTYALLRGFKGNTRAGDIDKFYTDHFVGMIEALGQTVINTGSGNKQDFVKKYILNYDAAQSLEDMLKGTIPTEDALRGMNIEYILTLNRLHQALTKVPALGDNFSNFIGAQNFKALAPWFDQFEGLTKEQQRKIYDAYAGTAMSPELHKVIMRRSSAKFPFEDGQVVFTSGNAKDGFRDKVYYLAGVGTESDPALISVDGARTTVSAVGGIENLISPTSKTTLIGDYNQSAQAHKEFIEAMKSSRLERILDTLTLDETGQFGGLFGKGVDYQAIKNANNEDLAHIMHSLIGRDTGQKVQDVIDTYAYLSSSRGLTIDQAQRGLDNTGASLIKEINKNIAEQIQRDYAGTDTRVGRLNEYYAGSIARRLGLTPEQLQEQIDNVTRIRNIGTGDFSFDTYTRQLDLLQKSVYDIVGNVNQYKEAFSNMEEQVARTDATTSGITRLQNILSDKDPKIAKAFDWMIGHNYNTGNVAGVQSTIYRSFKATGEPEAIAEEVFKWNAESQGDRIVGFGTYMGKALKALNADDLAVVKMEADWYRNPQNIPYRDDFLDTAINRTLQAMDGFTPTTQDGAFARTIASTKTARQIETGSLTMGVFTETVGEQQNRINKARQNAQSSVDMLNDLLNRSQMRQETIGGSFFEQAQEAASKLTAQQIGAGIAALAGIGLVNKLLHDEHKRSPLEAGHSGAKQPPILNGQPIGSSSGAPATPDFGRTVYHDQASGLNFHVSAKTKQRLSAINGAQGIGMAGGGDAQVYAFNDTRGVSDNWLANKFAELAE